MLLRNMSDELQNVNFVGIRIMDGRDARHFVQINSEDFNSPEVERLCNNGERTSQLSLRRCRIQSVSWIIIISSW